MLDVREGKTKLRTLLFAVLCLALSGQAVVAAQKADLKADQKTELKADLKKGEKINKTCALCHGAWGQGTTGAKSPRIAGMTKGFMTKILKEYRSRKRKNAGMVVTSGIHKMSDATINDISSYLAEIDLRNDPRFDVENAEGDLEKGKEIFVSECKGCHRKNGYGKPDKGVPALAGQQSAYIIRTIERFKARTRIHDDDPDDDLFDEMFKTREDMVNLTAYLSTLDDVTEPRVATLPGGKQITVRAKPAGDKKQVKLADATPVNEAVPGANISSIVQTVAKMELAKGVTREDAIAAMRSKAVELNMRLVGEQHVSKALEKRGEKTPYLAIFQFCNLSDAKAIVSNNPLYAAYMPCRVAMVEDTNGKTWLMMLNLDILVDNTLVSKKIVETVIGVNQKMLEIMVAGMSGEF